MTDSPADPPLIASLRAAVERAPDDLALRLHLAGMLLDAGRADESIPHVAAVLARDPGSAEARALMARAVAPDGRSTGQPAAPAVPAPPPDAPTVPSPAPPVEPPAAESSPDIPHPAPPGDGFDWASAETELGDVVPPMFVDGSSGEQESELGAAYDLERSTVRLADVGGMTEVKARLEAAFLAPMRNPELRRLYGKSLRGGLLMYGPPGCGKTFLARAVAGEMGAAFLAVSLADVLDMWIGQSERNLHQLFEHARRSAPCVLFLDEVDAIGQKRSHLRNSAMRGTVNQLLGELDSVSSANEGVFVLAATNHPWDVDSALRRPGRLDRTLLVLPPDEPAREAVLRYHLRDRPVAGIDLRKLAKRTDGYSGADLAHACETAAERAMIDAARTGSVRMIGMADFDAALQEVRPSIGPWFDTARNVALFANEGGTYDELLGYLKKRRLV